MQKHGKLLTVISMTAVSLLLIFFVYLGQRNSGSSADAQASAGEEITTETAKKDNATEKDNAEESNQTQDAALFAVPPATDNTAVLAGTTGESAFTDAQLPTVSPAPEITDSVRTEITKLMKKYYNTSGKIGKNIFLTTSQAKKEAADIKEKRNVIEKYKNIIVYIKPGLQADTYAVFTTYDMKVYNIDTLIPGMSLLYITKNENGDFRVNTDTQDEELSSYLTGLTQEEDIKALIDQVNSALKKATAKDSSLKKFVKYLKSVS